MSDTWPPEGYQSIESVVEGITIFTKPPEEEEQQPAEVDFTCPNCLATVAFSIADGGLKCSSCGYYEPPEKEVVGREAEEFEFKAEVVAQAAHGWGEARKELQCQNCYAVTTLPMEQLTHVCPFCGSSKVIQGEAKQDALRPRFIIPFKVTDDQLPAIVNEWLGSSWLTPGSLRNAKIGLFNTIYLPFWTFDANTNADWRAQVGYTKTRRVRRGGEWRTETYTDWKWESGHVTHGFDDLLVTGTKHVTQGVLNDIDDFDLTELAPYEPKYLAGINAQAYEITLDEAWQTGREIIRQSMTRSCESDAKRNGGDKVRQMSMTLNLDDESWRYMLLPVYLAPYTYQDETYQIVVNAQTGTIGGTRPVEWWKVVAAGGAMVIPALFLGFIGLFFPPLLCVAVFLFMAAIAGIFWMVSTARRITDPDASEINVLKHADAMTDLPLESIADQVRLNL